MCNWLRRLALLLIVLAVSAVAAVPIIGGLEPPDALAAVAPAAPRSQPDILLITIDALRADHLSAYGYGRLTSPALDALARRAVVFSNATTQAPYTKAAVASLMSGLYPAAHKTVTAAVPFVDAMTGDPTTAPAMTDVLPSGITTLAEALKDAGYRTLGFTGNPFLISQFGFGQGFDVFEFFPGGDFASASLIVDRALDVV